jgi:hypothetical protein
MPPPALDTRSAAVLEFRKAAVGREPSSRERPAAALRCVREREDRMDQEFRIDLAEVRQSVERADVITVHFVYFRETLVLDTRKSATEPPLARVRPSVATVDERIKDIRSLRPRFGRPESITYIPWPKFVRSLRESGVWDVLVDRMVAAAGGRFEDEMDRLYRRLRKDEWNEYRNAIAASGYKTLWQRAS